MSDVFGEELTATVDTDSRPDFTNFRLQLWKSMQLFADKCEANSREFASHLSANSCMDFHSCKRKFVKSGRLSVSTVAVNSSPNTSDTQVCSKSVQTELFEIADIWT